MEKRIKKKKNFCDPFNNNIFLFPERVCIKRCRNKCCLLDDYVLYIFFMLISPELLFLSCPYANCEQKSFIYFICSYNISRYNCNKNDSSLITSYDLPHLSSISHLNAIRVSLTADCKKNLMDTRKYIKMK